MSVLMSAMPAYLRMSLATMFQYRGEIVLWAAWGVVYPLVAMAAWTDAVKASPDGREIQGFAPPDFAAYFLLTMVVGHACAAWDVYEMGYLIRSGQMSPRLMRPILPIWQSVADNLAYKVLTLTLLIPIWGGVAWFTGPRFTSNALQIGMALPTVILAGILHYVWGYNLALAAFWVTRTDAAGEVWWGVNLLLGGRLFPVEIMPPPLQWLAATLPFKWIVWFPASALMGNLTPTEIFYGALWQSGWLVAGAVIFQIVWPRAVKQYSAVGN